jgi:hypothetical protein
VPAVLRLTLSTSEPSSRYLSNLLEMAQPSVLTMYLQAGPGVHGAPHIGTSQRTTEQTPLCGDCPGCLTWRGTCTGSGAAAALGAIAACPRRLRVRNGSAGHLASQLHTSCFQRPGHASHLQARAPMIPISSKSALWALRRSGRNLRGQGCGKGWPSGKLVMSL